MRWRQWPNDIWRIWERDHAKDVYRGKDRYFIESNFIYNKILGTTFSGHPTKTTFGNTIRSICYAYYYIEQAGFQDPWNDKRFKVRAAGDDLVILCEPSVA